MCMLWKCIVSTSNHCEVDRQRSSTPTPIQRNNTLGGMRESLDYWYRYICSNSIECTTNTCRKFALAWQLDSLGFWCPFCRHCTSTQFAFQPAAAAAHCDRWPGAWASHYDENNNRVLNDCVAFSKVPRDCEIICWYLLAAAASEWARWAIWKSNSKIVSII